MKGLHVYRPPSFARSNNWLTALILDKDNEKARETVLEATNGAGLMTRPVWKLLHHLSIFADSPRMDLTCAESLERRIINIPSSAKHGISDG